MFALDAFSERGKTAVTWKVIKSRDQVQNARLRLLSLIRPGSLHRGESFAAADSRIHAPDSN
jgi:hypothetical protein